MPGTILCAKDTGAYILQVVKQTIHKHIKLFQIVAKVMEKKNWVME